MAMTLAERIMARASGALGIGGRVRRRRHRPGAGTRHLRGAGLRHPGRIGAGVFDPDRIAVVIDLVPAPSPEAAEVHHRIRDHVARLGITPSTTPARASATSSCRNGATSAPACSSSAPTPTPPRTAR